MRKKQLCRKIAFVVLAAGFLTMTPFCSTFCEQQLLADDAKTVVREASAGAMDINISVDPRVELMSIIFRLAGSDEYKMCKIPGYDKDIDAYFKPYKDHPAVKFAAELGKRRGVGFNAPMGLAVLLSNTPNLEELVPLDPRPAELDSRWRPAEARKFLEKARLFAKESNFDRFYNDHKPVYEKAVLGLTQLIQRYAYFEWFKDFFGQQTDPCVSVVLGMANGPSSYAASVMVDGKKHIYAILGVWQCDLFGNPKFNRRVIGTIHHELCHSYSNPIVFKYLDKLQAAGQKIYPNVADKMRPQGYAEWQDMMYEYVPRVCTFQYYKRYGSQGAVDHGIKYEVKMGFVGMRELDELVSEYEKNREKYPTFESFFPQVVDFFNEYSKNLDADKS